MEANSVSDTGEKILEKLYHLFRAKVGVKVFKVNGEVVIDKHLGFTKVEVFGRDKCNTWVNIELAEIVDVVAAQ